LPLKLSPGKPANLRPIAPIYYASAQLLPHAGAIQKQIQALTVGLPGLRNAKFFCTQKAFGRSKKNMCVPKSKSLLAAVFGTQSYELVRSHDNSVAGNPTPAGTETNSGEG
jgi:hypothetical protein